MALTRLCLLLARGELLLLCPLVFRVRLRWYTMVLRQVRPVLDVWFARVSHTREIVRGHAMLFHASGMYLASIFKPTFPSDLS